MDYTARLAKELKIVGLMNIQYVIYNDEVYIIEVKSALLPDSTIHQ